MLFVFTATLRPFTETEASSTLSGSDFRGLRREERIFPKAFVPAFNRTLPLTETSWAIFASKLAPTASCDVIRLTVVTASVVPAGIVAAFTDEEATHAQRARITAIILVSLIILKDWRLSFQSGVS